MPTNTQGQWFRGPSADLGDPIDYSLRFKATGAVGSGTPYISRNFAGASSTTSTLSYWWKRGTSDYPYKLHWQNPTFQVYLGNGSSHNDVFYGNIEIGGASGRKFRDSSAWYHTFIQMNGGSAPRIWFNGVEQTITNSPSSVAFFVNGTNIYGQMTNPGSSSWSANNYLAEVYHVDGTSLPVTDFGRFNGDGVWVPVAPTISSWGTNGFHLKFDPAGYNASNGVGADHSGQNNHWTLNGHETTAISTSNFDNDISYLDTPTTNFATFNPLGSSFEGTTSDTNLKMSAWGTSGIWYQVFSTQEMVTGKYYWEVELTLKNSNSDHLLGVANELEQSSLPATNYFTGKSANSWGYYHYQGLKYNNSVSSNYGDAYAQGDIIGFAFDADTGTIWASKNGVWQGSATQAEIEAGTTTNAMYTGITGNSFFVSCSTNHSAGFNSINLGQRDFVYTAPTGYKSLHTANLPKPTIKNGKDHFDVLTYSGTGVAKSETGLEFQPDFVWIKERGSLSESHILMDSVRGTTSTLRSNTSGNEVPSSNYITSFDSNGFSLGTDSGTNGSSGTYVAWCWKAGGTAVSNTDGTITSSVSANTDAGFSIVSYTGNTTGGATIGHGLNSAPEFILVKDRDFTRQWAVYHGDVGNSSALFLNEPDQQANTTSVFWNSTSPTNSVFTVGTSTTTNDSDNYIAYCWHSVKGYSKFGSFTGNGSTDGPFIHTGMKPSFLILKNTSVSEHWLVYDTTRSPNNPVDETLYPSLNFNEQSGSGYEYVDILSNGFKMITNSINQSGHNYVYIAFAENPFGGENVPPATAR